LNLKQMSMPGSHDHIMSIMKDQPPGKLLDSPAGAGALSKRLSDIGYDVSCCDIDPGNFHFHDKFELQLADFNNDRLPYPDNCFDYIVCANGLHRLYYPNNILSEFSRVIKDDGLLILSWPNYNSMARRLRFFLTGSIGSSIDFAEYDQTITSPAAKIRFPLSTGRMEYLLNSVNVSIESTRSIGYQVYDYLLLPVSLVVFAFGSLIGNRGKDNRINVISGGYTTIAICRKSN